jgi:hypothetical protein
MSVTRRSKKIEAARGERCKGLFAVAEIGDVMAGFRECARQEAPERLVVLSQ